MTAAPDAVFGQQVLLQKTTTLTPLMWMHHAKFCDFNFAVAA